MLVRSYNLELERKFQQSIVLCTPNGDPRVAAIIWQSQAGTRYSQSYLRRYLLAIESLYSHHSTLNMKNLDEIYLTGSLDELHSTLRSYLAKLQNDFSSSGIDQSERWHMVIKFSSEVTREILHRLPQNEFEGKFSRKMSDLRRIESLYSYLRPPKNLLNQQPRALPYPVLEEIFKIISPKSLKNPFRTIKLKHRNFLIFSILLYQGLRIGELLNLPSNCVKHEFCSEMSKDTFWINIHEAEIHDSRSASPRIKNEHSVRQIPIDEGLATQINHYCLNYRRKIPHGFLFGSNQEKPLSKSALANIFYRVTESLSQGSKDILYSELKQNRITPHNLRHTCAVMRIKEFLSRDIEMGTAEELMRSFFGWSRTSSMPSYYTQAFYQSELQGLVETSFEDRLLSLGIGKP